MADQLTMAPWSDKVAPFKTQDGKPYHFDLSAGPMHHELVIGTTTYAMCLDMPRKHARCPTCNVLHAWAKPELEPHTCCGASMPSPWSAT